MTPLDQHPRTLSEIANLSKNLLLGEESMGKGPVIDNKADKYPRVLVQEGHPPRI